jgi:cholesterol transport system auxiliary component
MNFALMRCLQCLPGAGLFARLLVWIFVCFFAASTLSGCATRGPATTLYDFGPLTQGVKPPTVVRLPALKVAEVQAPVWMEGSLMFYRLGYANVQQTYPYAASRWSMSPAQLLGQRLKRRIAFEGGTVLAPGDGTQQHLTLRLELDEFIQIFASPTSSMSQLNLRASLFQGKQFIGQRQFEQQATAPSPDAAGGARALAVVGDAAISEILDWIASLALKP